MAGQNRRFPSVEEFRMWLPSTLSQGPHYREQEVIEVEMVLKSGRFKQAQMPQV